jgi:hypothetical protein
MPRRKGSEIEPGPVTWTKSRASGNSSCIEVSTDREAVPVRDSKDRCGPILTFTAHEYGTFLADMRGGDFDVGGEVRMKRRGIASSAL